MKIKKKHREDVQKPIAFATFSESFQSEQRVFYKSIEYPIYKINGGYQIVGENGEFNFTSKMWKEVKSVWAKEVGMKICEVKGYED
ncbi:hypothetical protein [Lactobacillus terrae]|uniref:hypothetical protein n=1 Tax=Lactobacillus terrae TaxID=2269374 RepID=UPI000C1B7716|nr:hypothetical protein [Lactobacillus terrae]